MTGTDWRKATTAGEALEIIRQQFILPAQRGLEFEKLFSIVAQNDPDLEVKHIYKLSEWPDAAKFGLDSRDIGVDRVAILKDGTRVAIQCKCYEDEYKINANDVDRFLGGSQNKAFDLRWLVATCDLTGPVWKMISNTNIRYLNFREYHSIPLKKGDTPPRDPFPLQQEAIDAVIEGFGNSDNNGRGQLIMACGTGKTFTSLRIAEHLVDNGGRILFLAPSIALVAQARKEWLFHTTRPLNSLAVCSDKSIQKGDSISLQEYAFAVTTNPEEIATRLKNFEEGVTVVFSTYQSLPKVIDAQQKHSAPAFDLALVDEAHRTAGLQAKNAKARAFQLIHDQSNIKCSKRLYMTATPRIYGEKAKKNRLEKNPDITITDMNDTEVYGPRFYRLTFRQAVTAGMLCDVRVICLGLPEDIITPEIRTALQELSDETSGAGKPPEIQEYMSALVIGLALNGWIKDERGERFEVPQQLPRTLAYANTIRRSEWLSKALVSRDIVEFLEKYRRSRENEGVGNTVNIEATHLDARHSAYERNEALAKLNQAEIANICRVITNCRLFSEGVDVPALSSVAFMDPKSSEVEIVQSIGRVMRKGGEDKKLGYIVAPFSLAAGQTMEDALKHDKARFHILGKVLRALQSHDETLYSNLGEVVTIAYETAGIEGDSTKDVPPPKQLSFQGLLENFKELFAQLADYSGLGDKGKLVADIIISAVKRSAAIFDEEGCSETLAEALGSSMELLGSLEKKEKEKKLTEACNTVSLILCNACLMHKRLEATGNLGELNKLDKMGSKEDVIGLLLEDWAAILKKDYKPIFEQAHALLQHLRQQHSKKIKLQAALQNLVNCAVDTSESLNELGYDHAGPLYHRILENAPSQGAFYTENLSALLMGKLAFNDDLIDWADIEQVRQLRVIDPCCGTGTLLMAGLNTIKDKARASQKLEPENLAALHRSLVENAIYGLDVTNQAVQLAACNLTLGAPDTSYGCMNMYTLEYGMISGAREAKQENVRHGSIELLSQGDSDESESQKMIPSMRDLVVPVSGTNVTKTSTELNLPEKFDVVMMNPPFTGTARLEKQFPDAIGKAMRGRLQVITNKIEEKYPEARKALAQNSIGPFFTPLADELVNKERGTLAKIVPCTALTSKNGTQERKFLANRFHIETVISSHDPQKMAFSSTTKIHEALFIARRKTDRRTPTRFIRLARMPANVEEVEELSKAIHSNKLGNWGSCIQWPVEKVQEGNWKPVQWYSNELVAAVELIESLQGLEISSKNYDWKPSDREFRGSFNYDPKKASAIKQANAYCSIAEDFHKNMASPPDTWAVAKTKKKHLAKRLIQNGGHVLVPCRVSTTSSRIFAIYSETPVIGSAFRPIDTAPKIPRETAKAYTVFLNSIFGILQFLDRRTKKLTYPIYETGHLKTLLLPTGKDLGSLTSLFDAVDKQELLRLSEAGKDSIRRALDHAVAQLLGVDPTATDRWRELLAKEPTISNKRIDSV